MYAQNGKEVKMFARVTSGKVMPKRIDLVINNFKEQVVPAARKMVGFKGSYFLVDRKNGKILGVAIWDTEENLQASVKAAQQLNTGVSQATATELPQVEIYEVAVQLQP